MHNIVRATARWLFALFLLLLGGCATDRTLMPTPHLYSQGHARLFNALHPKLQTSMVPIFFVTDRKPETDDHGHLHYGHGRSASLAFGEASVEIGQNLSWDAVQDASARRKRLGKVTIELKSLRELGRTPPTPFPFTTKGGFYEHDAGVLEKAHKAAAVFRAEINAKLALTSRKELLVFVHGYNNTFRDAALTIAEMWHFFGREGVPVLYSWPAGLGGLTGYTYDRESGEFTVHHLKMMLKALADNPKVEGINLISHSRGTDVATSALRELFIEARAAGIDPRDRFRLNHVVLAAPDLDFDLVKQRLVSEPIAPGVGSIDIYVSPEDKALGLAEWVFGSTRRVGRLSSTELDREELTQSASNNTANLIVLHGDGGAFGHSYFRDNPAVSSDIFLALRYGRKPGHEYGRPLQRQWGNIFLIDDSYLLEPR